MSGMIERVAIAMYLAENSHYPVVGAADNEMDRYRSLARTAVRTMRDPTDAMLDVVPDQIRTRIECDWQFMIDEALAE